MWSARRYAAAASTIAHQVVALDDDLKSNPEWKKSLGAPPSAVLMELAARAAAGTVVSLPLRSFEMESQAELAFRVLQGGLNTGKVVVRVGGRTAMPREVLGRHVVTGGTGGLGLLTSRWLAQSGARRLVLASRGGVLPRGSADAQQLDESGVPFEVVRCDAGQSSDVRRLVAAALPLSGVWHAAGVLADGVVPKQSAVTLGRVYAPKAQGAWALQLSSAWAPLRACALFSSAAALLGGAGQANYAAANSCLDALSVSRRARGLAAVSMQWGAWAEVGMAARGAAAARMAAMEAGSGFSLIGLAQGLAALGAGVRSGGPSVLGVLPVAWSRFLGGGAAVPAFLSAFAPRASGASGASGAAVPVAAAAAAAAGSVSLEVVMGLAARTAGGSVDADAPLMEAGVDSLGAVELRHLLQQAAGVGTPLPSTLVFDHPTARQLAELLQPKQESRAGPVLGPSPRLGAGSSVALLGQSALLPGGASSASTVRLVAACGADLIGEVPSARWDVNSPALASLSEPVASRVRYGGFVVGAELVDNAAFNLSPAETAAMDPCQRLVLEGGYVALHGSGLDRSALSGSLSGVYLGFAVTEFAQLLAATPAGGSVYAATGSSASITCGRLSYALGLHGPCASYDTACSAALTACHAALRGLQFSECTASLVAGVALFLAPGVATSFAIAGMTSARGRCHTFDGRADGYARGEACGAVVLGGREGDRSSPLAVVGSAVRQDGRSASLTAPNGQAQQGLLRAGLADTAVRPDELALHEAHGTGTALGDPIEVGSFGGAVLSARDPAPAAPLSVGGVKANIGHAEPAAGMTGLLRLASGLRAVEAPPNAQLRVLNPHLVDALRGSTGALPAQLVRPSGLEARGGVSSFGYSGTIVHTQLRSGDGASQPARSSGPPRYRRRRFSWRSMPHPFVQASVPPPSAGALLFRSPAAGRLHALVADHVVQSRVIFPGVGYLEMARAATSTVAPHWLRGVFFLQPLVLDVVGLHVECLVSSGGGWEVRSGEVSSAASLLDATVHCSGSCQPLDASAVIPSVEYPSVRAMRSAAAADVSALYAEFSAAGLQYGPSYRTLAQAWAGGGGAALARLRVGSVCEEVLVRPAELDDALCLSALGRLGGAREPRLPFAVESAQLLLGCRRG